MRDFRKQENSDPTTVNHKTMLSERKQMQKKKKSHIRIHCVKYSGTFLETQSPSAAAWSMTANRLEGSF